MKRLAILLACLMPLAAHAGSVQVNLGSGMGGKGINVFFADPGGGQTFITPQGSTNRYVFSSERDSAAGTHADGRPAFDRVQDFWPGDVIDIAEICKGRCRGPVKTETLTGLDPNTIYYTWLPDPFGVATIVCLSPCRAGSFWLPLENGELVLTPANFETGGK